MPAFRNERDALGDHVLERDAAERAAGEDHGARSGAMIPAMVKMSEVLPAPFGPTMLDDLAFADLEVDFARRR